MTRLVEVTLRIALPDSDHRPDEEVADTAAHAVWTDLVRTWTPGDDSWKAATVEVVAPRPDDESGR